MDKTSLSKTNHKWHFIPINRVSKAFGTLTQELNPANKVTFIREIDATEMDLFRNSIAVSNGIKPSYTALIVKAASIALAEFPYANRGILGFPFWERVVQFDNMDITVAIEKNVPGLESIVLADTICDIDAKSTIQITEELQDSLKSDFDDNPRWNLFYNILNRLPVYFSKWLIRLPKYFPQEWSKHRGNACFVNSPAKYGVDLIVGDMLWPLTISFGWVKERPIAIASKVEVRRTMPLFIIFDRRIMAGAPAARFFNRLAEILENASKEIC